MQTRIALSPGAPDRIELEVRSARWIGVAISGVVGAGGLVAASVLSSWFAGGVGLAFLALALVALVAPGPPAGLTFDNAAGWLLVRERPGQRDEDCAGVAYEALRDFVVARHARTTGGRPRPHWTVELRQRDLGLWRLSQHGDEAAALAARDRLRQAVRLSARSVERPLRTGRLVRAEETPEATVLRWPKRWLWLPPAVGLLGVAVFGGLLAAGWRQLGAVGGSFVLVLLAVIGVLAALTLVASVGKTGVVRIDARTLRAEEAGGLWRKSVEVPVARVAAVVAPRRGGPTSALRLVDAETLRRLEAEAPGATTGLDLAGILAAGEAFTVGYLTTSEGLELETRIREALRRRAGDVAA